MADILSLITEFISNTKVLEQIREVQVKALFSNVYFLVPFIGLMIWWLYRLAFKNFILTGLVVGLWLFSGSRFARDFIVGDELQLNKVLPVAGVGVAAIAVIVYILFIRSD
ncbi:MAG: hypothetical protein ACQES8_01765 [Thermodesulfobacteriota bacterium]